MVHGMRAEPNAITATLAALRSTTLASTIVDHPIAVMLPDALPGPREVRPTWSAALHERPQDLEPVSVPGLRREAGLHARVYVLDTPILRAARRTILERLPDEEQRKQFLPEVMLHEALLVSPYRTQDPREARMCFVPYYAAMSKPATMFAYCRGDWQRELQALLTSYQALAAGLEEPLYLIVHSSTGEWVSSWRVRGEDNFRTSFKSTRCPC